MIFVTGSFLRMSVENLSVAQWGAWSGARGIVSEHLDRSSDEQSVLESKPHTVAGEATENVVGHERRPRIETITGIETHAFRRVGAPIGTLDRDGYRSVRLGSVD